METETYEERLKYLPDKGRHVVANYDDDCVIVYHVVNEETADYATQENMLGELPLDGAWFTPSFLLTVQDWHESHRIIAVYLTRIGFDSILKKAVPADYDPTIYADHDAWHRALNVSWVRLRWRHDYDFDNQPLEQQAIYIGLLGKSGLHYSQGGWVDHIEDVTEFAIKGLLPCERLYPIQDPTIAQRLGVDS